MIPIGIGSDWISVNSKILYVRQKKKNYPQLESQIRVGPVLFSKRSIAQMRERERDIWPIWPAKMLKVESFFYSSTSTRGKYSEIRPNFTTKFQTTGRFTL